MIKLQEFAKMQGVTDRAVQKHLKKHEKALEGHFQRLGPNGTYLDDFACEFIRERMLKAPIVISEASEENEALRREIDSLQKDIIALQKDVIKYQNQERELLEYKTKVQYYLEGKEKAELEISALNIEKAQLQEDLEKEKTRPISFKEWFSRRK